MDEYCPKSSDNKHHWAIVWDYDLKAERERCLQCGYYADE